MTAGLFGQICVITGAVVGFVGGLAYLRDTLSGKTQPNRVTFLLWGAAPLIGAAAAFTQHVGWAVLPVLMSGLGPLAIFIASFFSRGAQWQTRTMDYLCGAFSVLALVLWQITDNADLAILFAILSDGMATLPTLCKAWAHPETETASSYAAALVNALTAFVAIDTYNFASCAFPIYLVLCCCGILWALKRKSVFSVLARIF